MGTMHIISKDRHIGDFRLDETMKYKQMVPVTDQSVLDRWSLKVDEGYNHSSIADYIAYFTGKYCTSETLLFDGYGLGQV